MVKKSKRIKQINKNKRLSGILLHPTSLPSKYGIGELGSELFKFVDLLKKYDQSIWQILPLGPTGYGNSPYQCFSAFAGNPFLISIEKMLNDGLLEEAEITNFKFERNSKVNFGKIVPMKWEILRIAYKKFKKNENVKLSKNFKLFLKENDYWLHDFALFMAIKTKLNNKPWNEWPNDLRDKNNQILFEWQEDHSDEYHFQQFVQFLFFSQWKDVKKYCEKQGILIIGDIPIFVSLDSADVWANRELFFIDTLGKPEVIAGVPPDYFSETGQRWGNPLYKWLEHEKDDYFWWKKRFKNIAKMVDLVRLDHFRGFEAYWSIPAKEKTAIKGKWIKGPGPSFFASLKKELKELPIIAENLGIITKEVENLRNEFELPGMKILQFAFDDPYDNENIYLPHNFDINNCVYTGTHDNETIVGWYNNLSKSKIKIIENYFKQPISDIAGLFIRECMKTVAKYSIFPLQDIMRIDNTGRMNFPGKEANNWEWKFNWDQLNEKNFIELQSLTKIYNRI